MQRASSEHDKQTPEYEYIEAGGATGSCKTTERAIRSAVSFSLHAYIVKQPIAETPLNPPSTDFHEIIAIIASPLRDCSIPAMSACLAIPHSELPVIPSTHHSHSRPPFASLVELSMTLIMPGSVSESSRGASARPMLRADCPPISLKVNKAQRQQSSGKRRWSTKCTSGREY